MYFRDGKNILLSLVHVTCMTINVSSSRNEKQIMEPLRKTKKMDGKKKTYIAYACKNIIIRSSAAPQITFST